MDAEGWTNLSHFPLTSSIDLFHFVENGRPMATPRVDLLIVDHHLCIITKIHRNNSHYE